MKKTLFAIALAMIATAGSAQVFVGGGLGLSSSKYKDADHSSTSFNLSPEAGYVLDDVWSFGLPISLDFSKTATDKAWDREGTTTWSIAPYARYTFFKSGIISCFVDGILGFSGVTDSDTNVSLAVAPGIAVSVTDNISLGLEYLYNRYRDNKYYVAVGTGTAPATNPFVLAGGVNMRPSDTRYDFHSLRASVSLQF